MTNRTCHQCGKQDHQNYMFQVEVKNITNDRYKYKWTCYPCQGEKHPIEQRRLELEEQRREEEEAAKKQEARDIELISKAWSTIYKREILRARKEMSAKLSKPFEQFDFSGIPNDHKLLDKFKKVVHQLSHEAVEFQFEGLANAEYAEEHTFLTEPYEPAVWPGGEYKKAGMGFAMFLSFLTPIVVVLGLWDNSEWWVSLGSGVALLLIMVTATSSLFAGKFPDEFSSAVKKFDEEAERCCDELTSLHEAVLQTTITELLQSNELASKRLSSRFGDPAALERMPYDAAENDRQELKNQLQDLIAKENFPDLIAFFFLYKIAEADGNVDEREKERIAETLSLTGEDRALASSFKSNPRSEKALLQILKSDAVDRGFVEGLIQKLFSVAAADGEISVAEQMQIQEIGTQLGFSTDEIDQLGKETVNSEDLKKRQELRSLVDSIELD